MVDEQLVANEGLASLLQTFEIELDLLKLDVRGRPRETLVASLNQHLQIKIIFRLACILFILHFILQQPNHWLIEYLVHMPLDLT